jgi:hypothetical protein
MHRPHSQLGNSDEDYDRLWEETEPTEEELNMQYKEWFRSLTLAQQREEMGGEFGGDRPDD